MGKKSFEIGSLDKAGKNVKTETGWVSVKKYKEANPNWVAPEGKIEAKEEVALSEGETPNEQVVKVKKVKKEDEYVPRYATIAEAQKALSLKKITQYDFVREQEAINKKHKKTM